jgi:hypothetical protein
MLQTVLSVSALGGRLLGIISLIDKLRVMPRSSAHSPLGGSTGICLFRLTHLNTQCRFSPPGARIIGYLSHHPPLFKALSFKKLRCTCFRTQLRHFYQLHFESFKNNSSIVFKPGLFNIRIIGLLNSKLRISAYRTTLVHQALTIVAFLAAVTLAFWRQNWPPFCLL